MASKNNFREKGVKIMLEMAEREKARLKLKQTRLLKKQQEGFIDTNEFQSEMATIDFAIHQLNIPEVNGVRLDQILEAGEQLPGIVALWDEATPEERKEIVMLILEPCGLYYDLQSKKIVGIKPRPAFQPIFRIQQQVLQIH